MRRTSPPGNRRSETRFWSNIQNVNQDYQNQVKAIDSATEASDVGMNPGDLLKMEYEVSKMTVEQEVTSKIGDSASQGVQQLFKNQ